jgi:RNA polymerase sigma-70 factor, ECF subfamily
VPPEKILTQFLSQRQGDTILAGVCTAPTVSHPFWVGEYSMIDRQRLHDGAYRWGVVEVLMREHADAILQYCLTWLGEGLAEEVTQEVFVTAWQGLPKYRPDASLRTWLFGIAHHKCQQAYRNRARRQAIAQTFIGEIQTRAHAQESANPEDRLAHAGQQARLHESLTRLPNEDRILLTLWYWKELPVAEIAEIMGKTEAAIRKRLTRAQQRLKELMREALEISSHPG